MKDLLLFIYLFLTTAKFKTRKVFEVFFKDFTTEFFNIYTLFI